MTLGERLEQLRHAKGITQLELSRLSGVTPATISRIEQGINPNPRRDTLLALADALQVSIADLVGDSDAERGLSHAEERDPKTALAQRYFEAMPDDAQDDILRLMQRMADPAPKPRKRGGRSVLR